MNKSIAIKRIAAIVLCITFFLPLSQCQTNNLRMKTSLDTGERILTTEKKEPPDINKKPVYSYTVPARMFELADVFSWVLLIAFVWPILFWTIASVYKKKRVTTVLNTIEPFACLGSGYVVWSLSFLGDILIGGYLALGSVAAYFFSSCYELYGTAKMRMKK